MTDEIRKHPFITHLEGYINDRTALAVLRKGLTGKPINTFETLRYIGSFYSIKNEQNLFLIAGLFSLHPPKQRSDIKGNMGTHMRSSVSTDEEDNPVSRRFVQLLSLHRDALDIPLRRQISILKTKEIAINWHQLAHDLNFWSNPSYFIQKQWASEFWRSTKKKSKS